MKRRRFPLAITFLSLLACIALFLLSGCFTVPITGRESMILLDEGTEMQMGASSYAEMKTKSKVSTDPNINAQAQRVGKRVAAATGLDYQWEFTVFDEPKTVNAFCLPGGKVGIYTGILQITQNEPGLATVVAHEVAHAVARHGAERYSQDMMIGLGGAVLAGALGSADDQTKDNETWNVAYGLGSSLFVALPHSRMQESEADRMGLVYMAKAGYDPREAVGVWERFKAYKDEKGQSKIEFLSTHPTDESRIENIRSHLPEALPYYNAATGKGTTPTPERAAETTLLAVPSGKSQTTVPTGTMFLKVQCPHCSEINRVPFSGYGDKPIKCFNCGRTFR